MITKNLDFFLDFKKTARLARPFLSNLFSIMLDKPNNLAPLFIGWIITYKCNCRCSHCSNRYDRPLTEGMKIDDELKTDDILRIAHEIGQTKVWGVSFTGGEPLVRDDIFEVVNVLKKYNKVVNLTTNGEFLNKYMDKIGLFDQVSVSIDSHRPEIHDYLRDNPGLFEKALSGIENIRKKHKTKIKVKCTISQKNILELEEFIEFWKDKAHSIVFQPAQNSPVHEIKDSGMMVDGAVLETKLKYLMKKYPFLNNNYYRYMPLFLSDPQKLISQKIFRCFFRSSFSLFLSPDGRVQPCCGMKNHVVGNAKDENIADIWKKAFEHQKDLRSKKSDCICWEDLTFMNLYLTAFFNFMEKVFFWKKYS